MSVKSPDRSAGVFALTAMGRSLFGHSLAMTLFIVAMGLMAPAAWASLSAVSKSFSPSTIPAGGTTTLTITIQNRPPPGQASGIAFTDVYPANLVNAATPGVVNTCGGTVTAVAGGSSLSLSGGNIGGNNSCSVSVSVTSTVGGSYLNSTGVVTSSNAGSIGPATTALTVAAAPSAAPSGFNAFETGTTAGSISGVIRTKVAANAFALDVVALNMAGTAVETAFSGDVRLELVDASVAASCSAYALIRNLGTLTFAAADNGRRALAGINEPNAWPNVRLRMSFPATSAPTTVACSTDNFAIRPASFGSVVVSDADSVTAGTTRTLSNTAANGGVVHKAGQPFRMAATALNAAGVATANYSGTPVIALTACVLPSAGCGLGALTPGTWSAAAGTVTTASARYSEVGAFTMKLMDTSFAAVDAADGSSAAEMTIESAAVNVGRFVPDHFDLATASTPVFKTFNDTSCATRSFTYAGQPFGYLTVPEATITAKNAAGAPTLNYAVALWKLAPAGVTQGYSAVSGTLDTGLVGAPAVTATGNGAGTLSADVADVIAFVRALPVVPFIADISLTMSIQDTAENAVTGNGTIDTTTPAVFSTLAFDAGNEIRFGLLAVPNAHGSELLNLPVPIETRFWNGAGFTRNTVDFCTQLAAAQVSLANWQPDLNACETSVSLSGRFNAGRGNLRFSAPGAGNTGSVDLAVQLGATAVGSSCVAGVATPAVAASQTWLQGPSGGGPYTQNPAARASFGLHRGNKPLIYLREIH